MSAEMSFKILGQEPNPTSSVSLEDKHRTFLEAEDTEEITHHEPEKEQGMHFCKEHPQAKGMWVCVSCKVCICLKCRDEYHCFSPDHEVQDVSAFQEKIQNQIEFLQEEAVQKVAAIETYTQLVDTQEAKVEALLKGKIGDIIIAYKESVQKLTRRKNELIQECKQYKQEMREKFQCIRERNSTVIEDISRASALVAECNGVFLLGEALTLHDTLCDELKEKIAGEEGDWELRGVLREADDIEFCRYVGQQELDLGEITRKTDWNLEMAQVCPLLEEGVCDMHPTPDGGLVVGYTSGGITMVTADGSQEILLDDLHPRALATFSNGDYVIQEDGNVISLYSSGSVKVKSCVALDAPVQGYLDAFAVDKDDNVLLAHGEWSEQADKILVFRPEGGGPIKEIPCHGFEPHCICPMNLSRMLVVRDHSTVWVIDEDGNMKHNITKVGYFASPAVLRDDSILIGWEKDGKLSIDLYTSELEYVRSVLTDFNTDESEYIVFLRVLSTGLVVFNDSQHLYFLRKS